MRLLLPVGKIFRESAELSDTLPARKKNWGATLLFPSWLRRGQGMVEQA
jgi:hypothetical protein